MFSRRRLIIDTDAKNEADDQYAVVHALLSPSLDVRGVIPAHFGAQRSDHSRQESRDEVDLLLGLLDMPDVVVADGADGALVDELTPRPSAGSRLIVEEAMRCDGRLYVAFLGPLTDMASALLEEPRLAERDVVVVWIGGPPYGDAVPEYTPEFNLGNDVHAANVVFASSVQIWQIPMSVYTKLGVGYAELEERLRPCGPLGDYLVQQLIDFNATHQPEAEFRSLGDSPAIGVVINPFGADWRDRPRRRFTPDGSMVLPQGRGSDAGRSVATDAGNRTVRVCEGLDTRWLLEDMFAKLRMFAAGTPLR